MGVFDGFFRRPVREHDPDTELLNQASEILDFANTAYFQKFTAYLDREASRPLKVGDHMDMIQSAVRANTLREIRDTLVKRIANARAALTETEEG